MLDGKPFYFTGTNAYYLMQFQTYNSGQVADALDAAKATGMRVVRTWGFADGYAWTNSGDPAIYQITPGVYNSGAQVAMDKVIAEAQSRGLHLIIALVNNWDDFGGMDQYVKWAGASSHDDFFTSSAVKQLYKNYVSYFLNRVNSVTGVKYKDDPTIMAWELTNELRCESDKGGTNGTVKAWVQEMGAYVKSIDTNHLVATGEEGFDFSTSGYSTYANTYVLSGAEGTSFEANTALSVVDFGGVHLYPGGWSITNDEGTNWITDHIHIAKGLGKPMMVGEFGSDHSIYSTWLSTTYSSGGAGSLLWEYVPQSRGGSGFDVVYPTDTAGVSLFQSASAQMNAKQ